MSDLVNQWREVFSAVDDPKGYQRRLAARSHIRKAARAFGAMSDATNVEQQDAAESDLLGNLLLALGLLAGEADNGPFTLADLFLRPEDGS